MLPSGPRGQGLCFTNALPVGFCGYSFCNCRRAGGSSLKLSLYSQTLPGYNMPYLLGVILSTKEAGLKIESGYIKVRRHDTIIVHSALRTSCAQSAKRNLVKPCSRGAERWQRCVSCDGQARGADCCHQTTRLGLLKRVWTDFPQVCSTLRKALQCIRLGV